MKNTLFVCEKVSCQRGGKKLVEELNLQVNPGELVSIRGSNGSGKTTLLRALAGLYPPQGGAIYWDQKDIYKAGEEFRLFCCYVGHRPAFKVRFTVKENLAFFAKLYETQELLAPVLKHFGLTQFEDSPVDTLSQGWQKRVALARLMLSDSILWLLDEPFANLDEKGVELVATLIKSRLEQGGMVVIASPDKLPIKVKKEITLGEV